MAAESQAFFTQMSECRAAYRTLADCIKPLCFKGDRVLDIGCGVGDVIQRLAEHGHLVTGWDCALARTNACAAIRGRICVVDLARPPETPNADVVICTETAEHLDASVADILVRSCVEAVPRIIVWSAAQPGQEWEGHVNLQASIYWLTRFEDYGYYDRPLETEGLRRRMRSTRAQHEYAADNFFVLGRARDSVPGVVGDR